MIPTATPLLAPTAHHRRDCCRICDGADLRPFLALGPQPLANAFLRGPADFAAEARFPLDLTRCGDCGLVQILDVIDPEVLFRDYIYVTGTSETIAAHNVRYARTVFDLLDLGPTDLVVEVASNDGSLLRCFQPYGVRTLGIEPARNIAAAARAAGVETMADFFDSATARRLRTEYGPARVVVGNNVLAHVDEPRDFLAGAHHLLTDDGLVIVEVPWLRELLDRLEYDTVYHEHLCYFSVGALLRLCEAVGLVAVAMERVPVHGGSLRLYAGRRERFRRHDPEVLALAAAERRVGMSDPARYARFAEAVARQRDALRALLTTLRDQGASVAGYGAPAKGNTLLNYCAIDTVLLPYTVDRNPMKVGMYTPGMHIPVLPVETILARQPDYLLILAWNFAEEIMAQQREYAARGGRFILPIPEPRVI